MSGEGIRECLLSAGIVCVCVRTVLPEANEVSEASLSGIRVMEQREWTSHVTRGLLCSRGIHDAGGEI
jgi:hypothetical protein